MENIKTIFATAILAAVSTVAAQADTYLKPNSDYSYMASRYGEITHAESGNHYRLILVQVEDFDDRRVIFTVSGDSTRYCTDFSNLTQN
jgi:hypothetical protein